MKPLIVSDLPAPGFTRDGFADLVLCPAFFHFVWGPQPSLDEVATYLGPRDVDQKGGSHWSDWRGSPWKQSKNRKHRDRNLAEFCQQYETVELWFDMRPSSQLMLIWLLDYFRSYPEVVARLRLRLVDLDMMEPYEFGKWRPPAVDVTEKELAAASAAWQAYRSPTPEACFNLLQSDLSALLLFKPVLLDLLAELPSASTGLGATEMRMLEMIANGYAQRQSAFPLQTGSPDTRLQRSTSMAICSTGSRSARNLPSRDSTKSCAR